VPRASLRRVCRVLAINRSTLYLSEKPAVESADEEDTTVEDTLLLRLKTLAVEHPTFGYRRLWSLLRFGDGLLVNVKRVHRLVKQLHLQVKVRQATPRPRVKVSQSRTAASNERWAMDVTHIYCGRDGWGHLAAVIDCHDREIVGFEFSLRGRAREAERALESACLARFGTVRPEGKTPVIRSDNGLVFTSRRFREACQFYRMEQEFITPYTPEQNGMIERFFRSLKEESVWQRNFEGFEEARKAIREWIGWYNERRPHQALGYKSPMQFRQPPKVINVV
jgi:putative transposase